MRCVIFALLACATLPVAPSAVSAQWNDTDVGNIINSVGVGVDRAEGTPCHRRLQIVKEGLEAAKVGQGIWWSDAVPPNEQLQWFEPGSTPIEYLLAGGAKIIINFQLKDVGAFMNIPDPTEGGRNVVSVGLVAAVAHEGAPASKDDEYCNPGAGDDFELRKTIENAAWTKINPCAGYIPPFPPPTTS